MSHLHYIKASPREDRSHSIAVADAFTDAYRKAQPSDDVATLDVFRDDLPDFDLDAVSAKYKIMQGEDHTDKDKKVWERIVAIIGDFKAAAKYVLAVPMWNLSIPYRLKQYIDILLQPGHTFTVTEDGQYQGLVTDKPVFIAYTRGRAYPAGSDFEAFDLRKNYLELVLSFIALTDIRSVVVEPTLMSGPEAAAASKSAAVMKAREIAQTS